MSGTIAYMAPEVIESDQCDYKQDIWSLGVILYSLLCGNVPFSGKSREEVRRAILKDQLEFKDSKWSKISTEC